MSIDVCAMACIDELVIRPTCCWCHIRLSHWLFVDASWYWTSSFVTVILIIMSSTFFFILFLSRFRFDTFYKRINGFGSFNTFLDFSVIKCFWCGISNDNAAVFRFLLLTRSSESFMWYWFFILFTAAQNAFCCWLRIKLYVSNRHWLYLKVWFHWEGMSVYFCDFSPCWTAISTL